MTRLRSDYLVLCWLALGALVAAGSCSMDPPASGSGAASAPGQSGVRERRDSRADRGLAARAPGGARRFPVVARPAWLGRRVLPEGPGGLGVPRPTPPVLRDRRFATIDRLPPPDDRRFRASVGPVPPAVARRSTWRPSCPVGLGDLSYIRMPFWGFDRRLHTGEMIVHSSVASDVVEVFEALFEARFPIEEMRVVSLSELRRQRRRPTGDGNVTSGFECRKATLSDTWSQHAYGLAVDINPFHNPYVNGEVVLPELAGAYTDRSWRRPGMIFEGDVVTQAFDAIGWKWGGRWSSLKDWMHFSLRGN